MLSQKLVLLLSTFSATILAGPIAQTQFGKVEGFEYPTEDGEVAEIFLGIPFAKPPVGNLRFEKPQQLDDWEDVYQATQFRNDCTPHYRLVAQFSSYSGEDCLHLNVIKPKKANKLPVLVWIHGGGYAIGSASQHGYKVFADKYATKGVIVVSIQYRLGFMGFFTDGTNMARGNMGLFDQAAALRWVGKNIEQFGGDSNRITLWGYSAGASSVSQLTLSPYTRNLYDQAFIMSASSYAGWATGASVVHHSKQFAKELGCDVEFPKECLQKISLSELFDTVEKLGHTTGNVDILKWGPIIDGDFIPEHPSVLMAETKAKPTVIGLSNKEGAYFTVANMGRVLADFCLSADVAKTVDRQFIIDTLEKKILYDNRFGENHKAVLQEVLDHYLNKTDDSEETNGYFLDKYTEILSDITFNVPIVREIRDMVNLKKPVYTYLFEHYNDAIWKEHVPKEARGSPHANEYHYLFELPVLGNINMKEEPESRIQHDFINMIVSFVKTGRPTVLNVDWKPASDPENIEYLNFGTNDFTIKSGLFKEAARFWDNLAEREGFDVVDPSKSQPAWGENQETEVHKDEL